MSRLKFRRSLESRGLTLTVVTTAANVTDVTQPLALLHGKDTAAFGVAGYQGVERRKEKQGSAVTWHIALRPGKGRTLPDTKSGRRREQANASIRVRVEQSCPPAD